MDKRGFWSAIGAYAIWGFLPVYWKLLSAVPAFQILLHRMAWSLVFLLIVLAVRRDWGWIRGAVQDKRAMALYLAASLILTSNWGVYIWAVNAGYIVETSLGYFTSPLISVVLGLFVFKEALRRGQWLAVGLAVLAVAILTVAYGRLPWIALFLAASWAVYGMIKKVAPLSAVKGLTVETGLVFLPALAAMIYLEATGTGKIGQLGVGTDLLLVGCGVATAMPLLLFASASRRLPLATLGFLQYLAPTIQFLLGVLVYGEFFDLSRLVGFGCVWLALIVFSLEGVFHRRKSREAVSRGLVGSQT